MQSGVGDAVGVGDSDADDVGDADGVGVRDADGVDDAVGVLLEVAVTVAVGVGVAVAVGVGFGATPNAVPMSFTTCVLWDAELCMERVPPSDFPLAWFLAGTGLGSNATITLHEPFAASELPHV